MGQDAYDKYFAIRLRQQRKSRGWTQAELALKADLTTHSVQMIEAGGQGTKLRTAARLAHALELRLDDLLVTPSCSVCLDAPPEGFICKACGAAGQPSDA